MLADVKRVTTINHSNRNVLLQRRASSQISGDIKWNVNLCTNPIKVDIGQVGWATRNPFIRKRRSTLFGRPWRIYCFRFILNLLNLICSTSSCLFKNVRSDPLRPMVYTRRSVRGTSADTPAGVYHMPKRI